MSKRKKNRKKSYHSLQIKSFNRNNYNHYFINFIKLLFLLTILYFDILKTILKPLSNLRYYKYN